MVELKGIEKEKENERKKGGRKVHCRTKKRRGKKKGKKEQGEEERDGPVDVREAGESTVEMEVDRDCPLPPIEGATQPSKRTRFLGPSKSAPSLLPSTSNPPLLSLANTQSQQTAQTQGQLSLTKRSNSISVNASTVVALKGTQAGLEVLRQKKTSDQQLAAKKIKRLPTLFVLS